MIHVSSFLNTPPPRLVSNTLRDPPAWACASAFGQQRTQGRQPVELPVAGLAGLRTDRHEVIAVDRGCPGGNRTSGTLRAVPLVARHAIVGCHVGAHHLEQVELRRDLEQCVGVLR